MLLSFCSHDRPGQPADRTLEHHDPRELGASSGSRLGSRYRTGHYNTSSAFDPDLVHPEASVIEGGQGPASHGVVDEDNLQWSWRQNFQGVMTYAITLGWPLVLFSIFCNFVLGVTVLKRVGCHARSGSDLTSPGERQSLLSTRPVPEAAGQAGEEGQSQTRVTSTDPGV